MGSEIPTSSELKAQWEKAFPGPRLPSTEIEKAFDHLCQLSSADFHAALPSYVLHALDHFDPDSKVCEFTVYALSPDKDYREHFKWWSDRLVHFTDRQFELVLHFLQIVESDERFTLFQQVKRGPERLRKLWAEVHSNRAFESGRAIKRRAAQRER